MMETSVHSSSLKLNPWCMCDTCFEEKRDSKQMMILCNRPYGDY